MPPSALGNYAASLVAQAEAAAKGCDQVVWLDAAEHRWIEEMGGMNLYFVFGEGKDARIVTPELSGALLPGITRDSLLQLATDLGYAVEERKISTEEWKQGNADGTLTEVFACGTAAAITPVGSVKSAAATGPSAAGEPGPVTMELRRTLLAIQGGQAPTPTAGCTGSSDPAAPGGPLVEPARSLRRSQPRPTATRPPVPDAETAGPGRGRCARLPTCPRFR